MIFLLTTKTNGGIINSENKKGNQKMEKALTWKEFYKLALVNYEFGGDGFAECWDERTFNEYVEAFGPISKKKALNMFNTAEQIWTDMQGYVF